MRVSTHNKKDFIQYYITSCFGNMVSYNSGNFSPLRYCIIWLSRKSSELILLSQVIFHVYAENVEVTALTTIFNYILFQSLKPLSLDTTGGTWLLGKTKASTACPDVVRHGCRGDFGARLQFTVILVESNTIRQLIKPALTKIYFYLIITYYHFVIDMNDQPLRSDILVWISDGRYHYCEPYQGS